MQKNRLLCLLLLAASFPPALAQTVVNENWETYSTGTTSFANIGEENCTTLLSTSTSCVSSNCPAGGPIVVSADRSRDPGSKSLRFDYRVGNRTYHPEANLCSARNEVRWSVGAAYGGESWYGFSVYPCTAACGAVKYMSSGDSWICQIKNRDGSGNRGGVQIREEGGRFMFKNGASQLSSWLGDVKFDQWNDIILRVVYKSAANGGGIEYWVNGRKTFIAQDYNSAGGMLDFKVGMYGWDPTGTTVHYYDAIKARIGTGIYQDVSPNGEAPPTPDDVPPPVSCTSSVSWQNQSIAAQTGTFVAQFDVVPGGANMNGVVGLSNGPAASYANLAAIVQFNPDGTLKARNGSAYAAANVIPYQASVSYRVRLEVNVATRTYNAYVTPAGGTQVTLGSNYAFRTEQNGVTQLTNYAYTTESCALTVSNFSLPGPGTGTPSVIGPVADAVVYSKTPDANGGTENPMYILSKASDYRAVYMRFNLSAVSGPVTNAKLRVYTQEWNGGTATDVKVGVKFVSNDTWTETGITWNNQPATGEVLSAGVSEVNNGYIEFDLTPKVQTELAGDKNISLYLYVTNGWADPWDMRTNLTAREGTHKPQLSITTSGTARLAAAGSSTLSPTPAGALRVYPNPATGGALTVETTGLGPAATYAILDARGRTLAVDKAQNQLSIPRHYFARPGVYLLQIRDGARVQTRRVVIGR